MVARRRQAYRLLGVAQRFSQFAARADSPGQSDQRLNVALPESDLPGLRVRIGVVAGCADGIAAATFNGAENIETVHLDDPVTDCLAAAVS
jgi:hypothetical protein